jgi:hypothetical protein
MTALEEKNADTGTKVWANSGDSHFMEPEDLWRKELPARLAELVPRAEKDPDGLWETVHVDGQSFRRRLPSIKAQAFAAASEKAPGARDLDLRIPDLDKEGIWAEVVFPSLGMWAASFRTPEVLRESMRVSNDWAKSEIMDKSPRFVPTAQVSTLDVGDAVTRWPSSSGWRRWVSARCSCRSRRQGGSSSRGGTGGPHSGTAGRGRRAAPSPCAAALRCGTTSPSATGAAP